MKIVELQSGTILTWRHLLVRGAPEGIRFEVPVKFFYIEHNNKRILFDTGQKPLSYQQPDDANFLVRVTEKETAAALLKNISVEPESIDYVVLSHLHADHVDGTADFGNAQIIIQKREAACRQLVWQNICLIDGVFDLFNDRRIICLPTYGHTPGHQSLLLKLDDSSSILLTGDAAHTHDALDHRFSPEEYKSNPEYVDTVGKLRKLELDNVKLIFSHE